MKVLNGSELAGFIKERQAHQVRNLRQEYSIAPKLAIIRTKADPVIDTYIRLKKRYGADILIDVEEFNVAQAEVPALLEKLNIDKTIHGIIIQLPLHDVDQTDEIVNMVAGNKDVDALGVNPSFDPATPMAIMWLLAGYNIELRGKTVLLIGRGKLVGAPLERQLKQLEIDVRVATRSTTDLEQQALNADVIITATGTPGIVTSVMVKQNGIVVDAGVASESGKTVGDVAPAVYERDDITITPIKGGVGPLTVCALFENVIRAARATI